MLEAKINSVPLAPVSIEDCTFPEVFVDLTYRCNMACKMCYSDSPSPAMPNTSTSHLPDLDLGYYEEVCRRLPNPTVMALVGGEPTLRKDILDIIEITHRYGHMAFISTNGIRFARDPAFTKAFADVARRGNTRLHMDVSGGYDSMLSAAIHGQDAVETKLTALKNMQEARLSKLVIACVLIRGLNEAAIPDVLHMANRFDRIVRVVKFRAQGHNGRWVNETHPYSTAEITALLEPHIARDDLLANIKLSGALKTPHYTPEPRCRGKNCCLHVRPSRKLEINILECFTDQGTCWRKGRLIDGYRVEPVFESFGRVALKGSLI